MVSVHGITLTALALNWDEVSGYKQASEYASILQYLAVIARIKYFPICIIVKYFERIWEKKEFETKGSKCVIWNYCTQIQHFPTSITNFEQVNARWVIIIKCDTVELEFDSLFINLIYFKINKFFIVLCYDYSNFGIKIMICCLGDTKFNLKN